jgi:hypothetical protein
MTNYTIDDINEFLKMNIVDKREFLILSALEIYYPTIE